MKTTDTRTDKYNSLRKEAIEMKRFLLKKINSGELNQTRIEKFKTIIRQINHLAYNKSDEINANCSDALGVSFIYSA